MLREHTANPAGADAAPAGDVDAGLDGDDVAVDEDVLRGLADAGLLVDLQADAVAEAVTRRRVPQLSFTVGPAGGAR